MEIIGIIVRIWKRTVADNALSRSAELAFYFTLSLFPFLIFLITLFNYIPGSSKIILSYLSQIVPAEAMDVIQAWVTTTLGKTSKELLSLSLLFAIWTASTGISALMKVLNVAYDVEDRRPFLKSRLIAIALLIALTILVIGGAILLTFGTIVIDLIASVFPLGHFTILLGKTLNYAVGIVMLLFGIEIIYYFGPNVKQRWKIITPGGIFSVISIIIVSYLFSLYLRYVPSYSAVYGSLGAIIVLMIWLYLFGLIIMVGAEINKEIESTFMGKKSNGLP